MVLQHIVGTLSPTRRLAITPNTSDDIDDALVNNNALIYVTSWKNAVIKFDHYNHTDTEHDDVLPMFLKRLNRFLEEPEIVKLGYTGSITVTTTGYNPTVFRVSVLNGRVSYQQAQLGWQTTIITA